MLVKTYSALVYVPDVHIGPTSIALSVCATAYQNRNNVTTKAAEDDLDEHISGTFLLSSYHQVEYQKPQWVVGHLDLPPKVLCWRRSQSGTHSQAWGTLNSLGDDVIVTLQLVLQFQMLAAFSPVSDYVRSYQTQIHF